MAKLPKPKPITKPKQRTVIKTKLDRLMIAVDEFGKAIQISVLPSKANAKETAEQLILQHDAMFVALVHADEFYQLDEK